MESFKKTGVIFIIIAALLWSFDGLLRQSLYILPPTIIVFWEHILGAILLLPFVVKNRHEIMQRMEKKEWIAILLVSLFSGALGTVLYTAALGKVNYIQFSVVVLLQQLQPIWAITTAYFVLKEKLSKKFIIWAVLALVSAYLVTFRDLRVNIQNDSNTLIAAGMALAAGMMWGSSTSFSKQVLSKISYVSATFLRFVFAAIFAFIFIIALNQTSLVTNLNASNWTTLLIITVSTGMVALLIYYFGLRKTPARVSAIAELIWPVSAIFIDYFYFHKTLSLTQLLGVAGILFAIYNINKIAKTK